MEIRGRNVIPTTFSEKLVYIALDPDKSEMIRTINRIVLVVCGFLATICTIGLAIPWVLRCAKDYSLLDLKMKEIALRILSSQRSPAIRISCHEHGGMGDEAFALKVYQIVKKSVTGTNVNVSLTGISEREEKKFALLDRKTPLLPLKDLIKHAEQEPTLLIHGPVPMETPQLSSITTTTWRIAEYSGINASDGPYERSGPGKGELGIFMDQDLYEAGQKLFESGRTSFREAIDLLENEELKALLQQNSGKYYFGYAHNPDDIASQYARDLIDYIRTDAQDIDVCLVSPWYYDKAYTQASRTYHQEGVINPFRELDRAVEVWTIDPLTGTWTSTEIIKKGEKKVRLFFIDRLAHNDFVNFLRASEPYTLVTGDQSLSEALSLGKIVFYETLGSKKYLRKNLISLSDELGLSRIKAILERDPYMPVSLTRAEISDPEIIKEARAFADHLYKERNLEIAIIKRVKDWLASVKV